MAYYWESHAKWFDGKRLAWYGDKPDEGFWASYWQEKLSSTHYDHLKTVRLSDSILGRVLSRELGRDDRILEAGCGIGNWVAILTNHGYQDVTGIEYAPEVVEAARQAMPTVNVCQGDALAVDCPENSYDAYLSFGVIEHRIEGPEPFLKEAWRILKPGGKAVITVPGVGPLRRLKAGLGWYQDRVTGRNFFQYGFQRDELAGLVSDCGLKPVSSRYFELDRLWIEDIKAYRFLARYRLPRAAEKWISQALEGVDGHMLLMIAQKPGDTACAG